jgi:hypothetical protein
LPYSYHFCSEENPYIIWESCFAQWELTLWIRQPEFCILSQLLDMEHIKVQKRKCFHSVSRIRPLTHEILLGGTGKDHLKKKLVYTWNLFIWQTLFLISPSPLYPNGIPLTVLGTIWMFPQKCIVGKYLFWIALIYRKAKVVLMSLLSLSKQIFYCHDDCHQYSTIIIIVIITKLSSIIWEIREHVLFYHLKEKIRNTIFSSHMLEKHIQFLNK